MTRRVSIALCSSLVVFAGVLGAASSGSATSTVVTLDPFPMTDTLVAAWAKSPVAPAPADAGHSGGGNLLGPVESFEGIRNQEQAARGVQPDAEGDVGQDVYVEWVNTSFAVYDKRGSRLLGPVPGNFLWRDVPSPCASSNLGDPVVLYDEAAGRWLLGQYAAQAGRYFECVAVSTSADPTGSYVRYVLEMPERVQGPGTVELFNDYSKLAVWKGLYLMTDVQKQPSSRNPAGAGVFAFERSAMLAGQPARVAYLDLPSEAPVLAADLDGRTPPPGDPLLVEAPDASGAGGEAMTADQLTLRRLHVDFDAVDAVTLGPPLRLGTTAEFPPLCPSRPNECVPQKDTGTTLDAIADRPMFRAAYRSFGATGRLVVLRTIGFDAPPHAALRWYEIRDSGGSLTLTRAGTYSPNRAFRWMGSAAMDSRGDIGLGFSISDASSYPSVGYSGVPASEDAPAVLEGRLAVGGAAQSGANQWGDYSSLSVDPVDDCSFWYTQEYYPAGEPSPMPGQTLWHTRIGSFRFSGCGATPAIAVPAGGPQEGDTVTADPGDWSDVAGVTLAGLSYEWRRCGADGGGCTPITGASGPTYTITSGDVDSTLRVAVRASSPLAGVASALSLATKLVLPIPATGPIDLAVTADTQPVSVRLGADVVYTLHVANQSDDGTATGVTLVDTPPAGADVVEASSDRGRCEDVSARPFVCNLVFLPARRTATIHVTVRPRARGRLENSATVEAAQLDPAPSSNAVASATTVTAAPLLRRVAAAHVARAARGAVTVSAAVTVDEPASFVASVAPHSSGVRLQLLRGSRLGATLLRARRTWIPWAQPAPGTIALNLRLARADVRARLAYDVRIQAVDADGLTATIRLPFAVS